MTCLIKMKEKIPSIVYYFYIPFLSRSKSYDFQHSPVIVPFVPQKSFLIVELSGLLYIKKFTDYQFRRERG